MGKLSFAGALTMIALAPAPGAEPTHHPSVVLLVSASEPYCSGTLLASRIVLTAAHCLELAPPTSVVVGGETIEVEGATKHPLFDATVLAHDVALVALSRDAHARPAPLAKGPHVGDRIRFVGFGSASAAPAGEAPVQHGGFQRVDSLNAWKFRGRPDPASPCARDSGGGVFDERGALVGVISSGDFRCSEWSLSTRVDAQREFVETAVPASADSTEASGCSTSRSSSSKRSVAGASLLATVLGIFGLVRKGKIS